MLAQLVALHHRRLLPQDLWVHLHHHSLLPQMLPINHQPLQLHQVNLALPLLPMASPPKLEASVEAVSHRMVRNQMGHTTISTMLKKTESTAIITKVRTRKGINTTEMARRRDSSIITRLVRSRDSITIRLARARDSITTLKIGTMEQNNQNLSRTPPIRSRMILLRVVRPPIYTQQASRQEVDFLSLRIPPNHRH